MFKGELYKSTGSFTTTFFVSASFVLVGVSLIYIVQRIRPDLVRKQEPPREEVIPSPSIHSASVVDTLSGMFVTEPTLSVSHLDPVEIGSYQRFDTFRGEDSRPIFADTVQGRLASRTEIEAVYKQAVDKMLKTEGTVHCRTGSNASNATKSTVPGQSHSSSIFSGSMMSTTENTRKIDCLSGLQINPEKTHNLPKSSESRDAMVNEGAMQLDDEGGVKFSGNEMTSQESDQGILQTAIHLDGHLVASETYPIATSAVIVPQTSFEANNTEQNEITHLDSDFSAPATEVQPLQPELDDGEDIFSEQLMAESARDTMEEEEVELVKLPPPPECFRIKRRAGQIDKSSNLQEDEAEVEEFDENTLKPTSDKVCVEIRVLPKVPSNLDREALRDRDDGPMSFLDNTHSLDNEDDADETQDVNELLELVRIPPPPAIPRTGQLVALETEGTDDHDHAFVSDASLSEITLDAGRNYLSEKEVVSNHSCSKEVSTEQQKERLHLAVIDQLNLLSERLEAVAARQVQEEEEELENGAAPDQRPVFSPALQSLPLTPLYSANHSVPLTPVRAWSNFVDTPAPTPIQTPPSAFHTTAPTPIPTPQPPSQSVSGVFNVTSDIPTPSSSQDAASQHRSRCSSSSEVGQESVLNEWSHLDAKDTQGSIEAFSSKASSGTNWSIANNARSVGDFNSVSEPIDIVGTMAEGSQGGHLNSPVNSTASLELESPLPVCLPQHPYRQSPKTEDTFQETNFNTIQTQLQASETHEWTNEVNDTTIQKILPVDVMEDHLHDKTRAWLLQQTPSFQNINTTNDSIENRGHELPVELKPYQVFSGSTPGSANIPQPSRKKDNYSYTSEQVQTYSPTEFISDSAVDPMMQTRLHSSTVESKLNPYLDSDQKELRRVTQQISFDKNEVCSKDGDPDEFLNRITSNSVTVPIQRTQLKTSPVESGLNAFSDSHPREIIDVSQPNPFQVKEVCLTVNDTAEPLQCHITSDSVAVPMQQSRGTSGAGELHLNLISVDLGQEGSIEISHQISSQDNEACPAACVPNEPQNHIASESITVPIQKTRLDSSLMELNLNPLLDSGKRDPTGIPHENSHQKSSQALGGCSLDGDPGGSQNNPCQFSGGLDPRDEQLQPYFQTTAVSTKPVDFRDAHQKDTTLSPMDRLLSQGSEKANSMPQAVETLPQHDQSECLVDEEISQQNPLVETIVEGRREDSETELTEHASRPLDIANEESDHMPDHKGSWTTFSRSEEALIFEMDTESESSSDYSARSENDPTSSSIDPKNGKQGQHDFTTSQRELFPPLQIFSDIVEDIVQANRPGIPQKLPPPPRQAQRKRTDIPVCTDTVFGNNSQANLERVAHEGKSFQENQGKSIQNESVTQESETCPVSIDADFLVIGIPGSEVESELLSDSKTEQTQDQCSSQLSDNSITEIMCEEFELIDGKDDAFINEELDASNQDGDVANSSVNEDIAPLLMQSEDTIQYLNLRDIPGDCPVLQKIPSTTSSTDDSSISSTSTDSSLSENEMPYSKLHENVYDTAEHG